MAGLTGRLVLAVASAVITFVSLHGAASTALACSIGTVTLERAVTEADAAAIVYVESVRGPVNSAPPVGPAAPPGPRSTRTRPVDLTGYGATLRVYLAVYGDLPPEFDVDVRVRQGMEHGLRLIEAGAVPPCPVGFAVAHYIPGQDYVVLLRQTESGWESLYTFNYRIEGSELLATKIYDHEQREWAAPWDIEMQRPLYERFFAGTGHKVYPSSDAPPGVVVAPDDEIWRLNGPRVSLGDFVAALRFVRSQPSFHPPTTGDGGLQD